MAENATSSSIGRIRNHARLFGTLFIDPPPHESHRYRGPARLPESVHAPCAAVLAGPPPAAHETAHRQTGTTQYGRCPAPGRYRFRSDRRPLWGGTATRQTRGECRV